MIHFRNIGNFLEIYAPQSMQNLRRFLLAGDHDHQAATLVASIPKDIEESLYALRLDDIKALSSYTDLSGNKYSIESQTPSGEKFEIIFNFGYKEQAESLIAFSIRKYKIENGRETDFELLTLSNETDFELLRSANETGFSDKHIALYNCRKNKKLAADSKLTMISPTQFQTTQTFPNFTSTSEPIDIIDLDVSVHKSIRHSSFSEDLKSR